MGTVRKDRLWIVLGAVMTVIIAAAAWLLAIGPTLDEKAASQQQLADIELQNVVLQGRLHQLTQAQAHLDDLQAALAAAEASLPGQHDLDAFTDQLAGQAAATGVTLTAISPGTPVALANAAPPPSPPTDPAEADAAEHVTDGDDDGAAAAPPADSGPAGQIFSLPVTVVSDGPIESQRAFTRAVQQDGPRTALVIGTALEPLSEGAADAGGAWWTMTTQLTVFVAPQADTGDDPGPPATR